MLRATLRRTAQCRQNTPCHNLIRTRDCAQRPAAAFFCTAWAGACPVPQSTDLNPSNAAVQSYWSARARSSRPDDFADPASGRWAADVLMYRASIAVDLSRIRFGALFSTPSGPTSSDDDLAALCPTLRLRFQGAARRFSAAAPSARSIACCLPLHALDAELRSTRLRQTAHT